MLALIYGYYLRDSLSLLVDKSCTLFSYTFWSNDLSSSMNLTCLSIGRYTAKFRLPEEPLSLDCLWEAGFKIGRLSDDALDWCEDLDLSCSDSGSFCGIFFSELKKLFNLSGKSK